MYTEEQKRHIYGASLIGVALVGGAFVYNNFTTKTVWVPATTERTAATALAVPPRDFIPVVDTNDDGVEDWREEFVVTAPLDLPASTSSDPFIGPRTYTDQIGIQLFESAVQSRERGAFGRSNSEIVERTADKLTGLASDVLYGRDAITVVTQSPESIRAYGNAMGASLMTHNVVGSENELDIVDRALRTNNPDELKKLIPLTNMYLRLRDDALKTPVPEQFANTHLQVVNSYHALYRSLSDLQLIFNDPVISLLRIKRYQDDVTGLNISLQQLYRNGRPYAELFTEDDPAMVLEAFAN